MARCRICHANAEVNSLGRCSLCQTAYIAAENGISYGNLIAKKYDEHLPTFEKKVPEGAVQCKICGSWIFHPTKTQKYCCPECADEARSRSLHAFEEKRKQDARKAAEEACGMAKTGDRESALER